jgi:hypothetical protein
MELNKKKSGILVFAPRSAKKIPFMEFKTKDEGNETKKKKEEKEWTPKTTDISGVPIVSKYKYLGTYLDSKLTMKTQLAFIRKKSNFLYTKLYPYLIHASANGRKDMWRTMVCPLFNGALALFNFEPATTHLLNFLRLWRYTFKMFMMIPKSTNTELVDEMIGINIFEIQEINAQNSARKWQARRDKTELELMPKPKVKDYLRGISNDWCQILKHQCSLCPICQDSTKNANHMDEKHNIEILSYKILWEEIKEFHDKKVEEQKKKNKIMKVKRQIFLEHWSGILTKVKEMEEERMKQLYIRN